MMKSQADNTSRYETSAYTLRGSGVTCRLGKPPPPPLSLFSHPWPVRQFGER